MQPPTEDVGVAEGRRTVGGGAGASPAVPSTTACRNASIAGQTAALRASLNTDDRAGVGRADRVVVADELVDQRVGARRPASPIAPRSSVVTRSALVPVTSACLSHALEPARGGRVGAERVQERVVDDVEVLPSGEIPMKAKSGRSPDSSTASGRSRSAALVGELDQRVLVVEPAAAVRPTDRQGVRSADALGAPLAMSRLGNELVRAPAMPSNEIDRTPSKMPTSVTSRSPARLLEGGAAVEGARHPEHACFLTESSQTA